VNDLIRRSALRVVSDTRGGAPRSAIGGTCRVLASSGIHIDLKLCYLK
jgi:hypothetical protein